MYKFITNKYRSAQELNNRYFRQTEDGIYLATPLAVYVICNKAKAYFGELVKQLDDENNRKYTSLCTTVKIDAEKTEKKHEKYAGKLQLVDIAYNKYIEEHPEEYNQIEVIDTGSDEDKVFLKGFQPTNIRVGLEEAIQAYWSAGEILKKYGKGGEEYENLPKYISKRSKEEFKEKHIKFKEQKRAELDIPPEEKLTVKKEQTYVTLKKGRHPAPTDDTGLENYYTEYVDYLKAC